MTADKQALCCTFGSLFSGIDGLALGLERSGMECRWQSEIKPHAVAVLKKHWPDTPNHGDITTIDWSTVEPVDLIAGGFPCQDLSHAHTNGSRAGLAGAKSGLWDYFNASVEALEPRWVIVENVDTWRNWVPTVRADLARLGYASVPVALYAGSFGAPHRRQRCFVVADSHGDGESLRAIHAKAQELRPVSGPNSRDWSDAPSRTVLLDDGVPRGVGELDAYGNAVVPSVAQWVGSQILEAA